MTMLSVRMTIRPLLALFLLPWLLSSGLHAETITVPLGGDIQAAIDAAEPFDEIELEVGVYFLEEPLLPMGKYVTLRGALDAEGRPASTLNGQGKTRHISCVNGEIQLPIFENLLLTTPTPKA